MAAENEPTGQHALAALSMWVWMACVAAFIAVAYDQAPEEKKTLLNVLPSVAINVVILTFAGWVSVGVRRGERLTAAAGLLILYGIGWLMVAAILLGMKAKYMGSGALIVSKVVLLCAWLVALVMVLRAKPPKQTGGVVTTR